MENSVNKREIIYSITEEITKVIEEIKKVSEQRVRHGDLLYLMNIQNLCGQLHGFLMSLIVVDDSYKSFVTEYTKVKDLEDSLIRISDEIYRRIKSQI